MVEVGPNMSDCRLDSHLPGRIAALDFGTVRIGIAVTDPQQKIASPYANYERRGEEQDAHYFCQLVAQEKVALFVVGLPVLLSGAESQKSLEARRFGAWVTDQTGIRAIYFDERFTTCMADELLSEGNFTKKQRKSRRDKLAAQILLTAYLEAGPLGSQPPLGLDDH
jgi:putative Holliday junction resolvase